MIELDKLSKQNKNFGYKLFFSYLAFTALLIVAITVIHLYFSDELRMHKFERESSLQANEKKLQFDNYFKTRSDALKALANNEYFIQHIKDGSYQYYIDLLFLTIMESNKEYMQIRFIGKNGHEKLRYDREKQSHEPYKSNTLQNKSNRYYFKAASLLSENDVWFSEIDLNIEHGYIEKPFKPVARVATPLYINKQFQGILIINLFMDELLNNITKSVLYDIYLADEAGYYIRHKNPAYNWSLYDSKHSIDHDFADDTVYKIQSNYKNSAIVGADIFVQSLFLDNQKINMIFVEKDKSIQEMNDNNNKMIVAILFFATVIAIIFSFILAQPLKRMYEIVVDQGDELHDLATNLDRKVALESLKNAKKDRLLQHQSKLAELGDMIGNIAHQWRHPLTRLSLTLQNLKAFKNKGKLSDKHLEDALENSLYQIEFMSNTIDNFKNFYKKDLKKSDFKVGEALENILQIIGSILQHSNIKLIVKDEESLEIFGNKNEFSQVLMNVIMNAKDAFEERKIENPEIIIEISKNSSQKVTIDILDNAGGIPETIIDDIFDPYFTTKDEKGTGIGLYLSKAIIEDKMKGTIEVFNEEKGAHFKIIV